MTAALASYRKTLDEAHNRLLSIAGPLWIDEGETLDETASIVREAVALYHNKMPSVADAVLSLIIAVHAEPIPLGWKQNSIRFVESYAQAKVLIRSCIHSLESVGPLDRAGLHEAAWVRCADGVLWARFYLESQQAYARELERHLTATP